MSNFALWCLAATKRVFSSTNDNKAKLLVPNVSMGSTRSLRNEPVISLVLNNAPQPRASRPAISSQPHPMATRKGEVPRRVQLSLQDRLEGCHTIQRFHVNIVWFASFIQAPAIQLENLFDPLHMLKRFLEQGPKTKTTKIAPMQQIAINFSLLPAVASVTGLPAGSGGLFLLAACLVQSPGVRGMIIPWHGAEPTDKKKR